MKRQSINTGQRLSPSARKIIKLRQRAFNSGGASLELQIPTNYIRDISRKLSYDITSDASLIMSANTIGEGRLFNCVPQNNTGFALRNLLQQSEDFSNAVWGKSHTTATINSAIAPNGTNTANKLTENNTTNVHAFFEAFTPIIGSTYTSSIYVLKYTGVANTRRYCYQSLRSGTDFKTRWVVVVDLQNGIVTDTKLSVGTGTIMSNNSYSIVSDGNYWRVSITAKFNDGGTNVGAVLFGASNSPTPTYDAFSDVSFLGDGVSSYYYWGAQLEQNSTATAYQRTTDGITDFQATRATTATVVQKDGTVGDGCYNLFINSEDFTNASWTKENTTVTANSVVAPNGNLSATKLTETNSNSTHSVFQSVGSKQIGTQHIFTVHVRKFSSQTNERNNICLQLLSGSDAKSRYSVVFDLTTGLATAINNFSGINPAHSNVSYSVKEISGYWVFSITGAISITSNVYGLISGANSGTPGYDGNNQPTYSGVTLGFVYIWGAQLTQGSTVRDYLRTTTRLAVPSLDYSLGSSAPALLVEPQGTNLLLQSNTVTTPWNQIAITASNVSILNPFGTNQSISITDNGTNGLHYFSQNINAASGLYYVLSGYMKPNNTGLFYADLSDTSTGGAVISGNMNTMTYSVFATGNWSNVTGILKSAANGWFYFYVSGLKNTSSLVSPRFTPNNTNSYTGVGQSIYISSMQVEQSIIPTSYIPTTTATVTRNAYTSYVDLFNNSLLNKDNFTLYLEGQLYGNSTTNVMVALSDTTGTGARANDLGIFDSTKATYAVSSSVTSDTVGISNNTAFKICIVRNGTSVKWFRNGAQIWSTQTIAVFDYRYLVVNNGGSTFSLKKIALFKHTKSDAECVTLTT